MPKAHDLPLLKLTTDPCVPYWLQELVFKILRKDPVDVANWTETLAKMTAERCNAILEAQGWQKCWGTCGSYLPPDHSTGICYQCGCEAHATGEYNQDSGRMGHTPEEAHLEIERGI